MIETPTLRRDKIITRAVSFVLMGGLIILLTSRYFFFDSVPNHRSFISIFLFTLPILFSYVGWPKMGSLFLSWSPVLAIYYNYIPGLKELPILTADMYDALKILLLGFSAVPFLVLDSKDRVWFYSGISVSLIGTLFCDPIFDFFGVGPDSFSLKEELAIRFNTLRTTVAYFCITGSAFSLRFIVDKGDRLNQKLIAELEQKSRIIQEQANSELSQLNQQLLHNLDELIKRGKESEHSKYLLNERLKELSVMYRTSQLLNRGNKSEDILNELVSILPSGWQYPEICEARIQILGRTYKTKQYKDSIYRQSAELRLTWDKIGVIEVVYLEDRPNEVEGPFLLEERNLIDTLADMIQIYLERKHEEDALIKAKATLNATINNTEIFIWSVDRDFKLLMFNRPFEAYAKEFYGVQLKIGQRVPRESVEIGGHELSKVWQERYMGALAGEVISVEEVENNLNFSYSLSPIIEKGQIIGVSVFAQNITERYNRERELLEANRKIGELKVRALRSVMNPHFIFNVLNSIQFFIAKNDRQNAINYLSTFSKLIRTVLTHSVAEKIKLTDELDMLRNYIELEKVRFDDKFSYKVEIDEDVEVNNILIPSLLIQPYIENAILHGLYNKEGQGQLTIRIKADDEFLNFEIEDDGVGREEAARIRATNKADHKSMGTKLTEERLRAINQHEGTDVFFEDLFRGSEPVGTKVTIKVKFN